MLTQCIRMLIAVPWFLMLCRPKAMYGFTILKAHVVGRLWANDLCGVPWQKLRRIVNPNHVASWLRANTCELSLRTRKWPAILFHVMKWTTRVQVTTDTSLLSQQKSQKGQEVVWHMECTQNERAHNAWRIKWDSELFGSSQRSFDLFEFFVFFGHRLEEITSIWLWEAETWSCFAVISVKANLQCS